MRRAARLVRPDSRPGMLGEKYKLVGADSTAPCIAARAHDLPHPHLVEQHAELGIEDVIAYSLRNEIGFTQGVEWDGRSLVHEEAVDPDQASAVALAFFVARARETSASRRGSQNWETLTPPS